MCDCVTLLTAKFRKIRVRDTMNRCQPVPDINTCIILYGDFFKKILSLL